MLSLDTAARGRDGGSAPACAPSERARDTHPGGLANQWGSSPRAALRLRAERRLQRTCPPARARIFRLQNEHKVLQVLNATKVYSAGCDAANCGLAHTARYART